MYCSGAGSAALATTTVVYSIAPCACSISTIAGGARFLLPDRDVEALHARAFLIDDRVDGDGGLAGLAVADDQLALAAADGDHAVDRLDAGLQRLLDRLPLGDAGSDDVHLAGFGRCDRAAAVERLAQRIHHAAHDRFADRHLQQPAGDLTCRLP